MYIHFSKIWKYRRSNIFPWAFFFSSCECGGITPVWTGKHWSQLELNGSFHKFFFSSQFFSANNRKFSSYISSQSRQKQRLELRPQPSPSTLPWLICFSPSYSSPEYSSLSPMPALVRLRRGLAFWRLTKGPFCRWKR